MWLTLYKNKMIYDRYSESRIGEATNWRDKIKHLARYLGG